jgi:2-dehydro-3-deoxygluconokinase
MIELSDRGPKDISRGYGGDTLNTAVYMARLAEMGGVQVDYATAIGDDPYSDEMLDGWRAEGVGTDLVWRQHGQVPGLYMIRTDAKGERTFHYWRSAAPAKTMFDGGAGRVLMGRLAKYDWLYFSGITLGVLTVEGRLRLFETLRQAKDNGAKIAFDGNYRPRLWEDEEEARAAFDVALSWADIALPSFEDEQALYDDEEPEHTAARMLMAGVEEVVVKNAGANVLVAMAGGAVVIENTPHPDPVDTTAAGDSFNAAYLVSRMRGETPEVAAQAGAALAYQVIGVRGAIMPRALDA